MSSSHSAQLLDAPLTEVRSRLRHLLPVGVDVVEWLKQAYDLAAADEKSVMLGHLARLLTQGLERCDEDDEPVLLLFVDFLRAVKERSICWAAIHAAWAKRQWVRTDLRLHGSLLQYLLEGGHLDIDEAWAAETAHQEFAPLVFGFVRDVAPEKVPGLIPDISRLGFMVQALQSISYASSDSGEALLASIATTIEASNDSFLRDDFCRGLASLNLQSDLLVRVLATLSDVSLPSVALDITSLTEETRIRKRLEFAGLTTQTIGRERRIGLAPVDAVPHVMVTDRPTAQYSVGDARQPRILIVKSHEAALARASGFERIISTSLSSESDEAHVVREICDVCVVTALRRRSTFVRSRGRGTSSSFVAKPGARPLSSQWNVPSIGDNDEA